MIRPGVLGILLILSGTLSFASFTVVKGKFPDKGTSYVKLARELLQRVKEGKDHSGPLEKLQRVPVRVLDNELESEEERLAFWLNVYNAHIQLLLKKDPELYQDRDAFFGKKQVLIAGKKLSFDKIEHGIIRRSKIKASMGHMQKPFPGSFEKKFRTKELDPRIHFALNCGAKSCPPVAVYHADRLDKELDYMAKTFLKNTTELNEGKARVTALFSWFRGDFGGKDGVRKMLKEYGIIAKDAEPELVFKDYDWTLSLNNYQEWKNTPLGAYR